LECPVPDAICEAPFAQKYHQIKKKSGRVEEMKNETFQPKQERYDAVGMPCEWDLCRDAGGVVPASYEIWRG